MKNFNFLIYIITLTLIILRQQAILKGKEAVKTLRIFLINQHSNFKTISILKLLVHKFKSPALIPF